MQKRQKIGWLIFSLLLWAQFIFTVGLTAWQYQLVVFFGWAVYASNQSLGTEQFVTFADQRYPENAPFAYLSSHYRGASRFRYGLYPRHPTNLSMAVSDDPTFVTAVQMIEEEKIASLVIDYLAAIPIMERFRQIRFFPPHFCAKYSKI